MSNRPKPRRQRRARPSTTRLPYTKGRTVEVRLPVVAPPVADIRAAALGRAREISSYGVHNQDLETIITLCDHIIDRYPWRQVELRNEQRRRARRDRWQRRPVILPAGLEWADVHRAEILEHWNATQRLAPIEGAGVWIIPDPGMTGEFERANCPHCTLNGVGRGCDRCHHRGTLLLPKKGTP